MTVYKAKILPQDVTIDVLPNEAILDAAIRQGVSLPYVCRNGTCRTCMCVVHEGVSEQEDRDVCIISQKEIDHGRRLVCMATAKSDLVIEKISPRQKLTAQA